jgi:hypothetical protein
MMMVTCEARCEKRYWLLHFTFRLSAPSCGILVSKLAGLAKSWADHVKFEAKAGGPAGLVVTDDRCTAVIDLDTGMPPREASGEIGHPSPIGVANPACSGSGLVSDSKLAPP